MVRLKRLESQVLTRDRILAAAQELFGQQGYASTSVDQIAEAAGFSKGAFYSNFNGKEQVFLAVLDAAGTEHLSALVDALRACRDTVAVITHLAAWADQRSRSGTWSLTILEHARLAPGSESLNRQKAIISAHWRLLGECLRELYPRLDADAATLGALLHEIAYAPALTFMTRPTAGMLMTLVMTEMLKQHAPTSPPLSSSRETN